MIAENIKRRLLRTQLLRFIHFMGERKTINTVKRLVNSAILLKSQSARRTLAPSLNMSSERVDVTLSSKDVMSSKDAQSRRRFTGHKLNFRTPRSWRRTQLRKPHPSSSPVSSSRAAEIIFTPGRLTLSLRRRGKNRKCNFND